MKTLAALAAGLLALLFLIVNWSVFAAPASFYFLVGTISLPIGVVMLALIAVVTLVYAVYLGIWQGKLLMDYRRQSKELQTQRTLADDAEASRFTALSTLLRDQMTKQEARFDAAFAALRTELRESERSLAATLGEMDDRQQRESGRPPI